jgi:hypothetical protein
VHLGILNGTPVRRDIAVVACRPMRLHGICADVERMPECSGGNKEKKEKRHEEIKTGNRGRNRENN